MANETNGEKRCEPSDLVLDPPDSSSKSKKENVSKSKVDEPKNIAWFRSEPMALCQLFLQAESAYACVDEFGKIGMTEFRDLNPDTNAFQRKFINELSRCNEMERQLCKLI